MDYKQKNLINNDLSSLLVKDLREPHNNAIKQYFILQQNNILKDAYKYIFDSKEYLIHSRINGTLQIGINQNILIILTIELNPNINKINFFLNKNLNIISINQNFHKNLSLSLALIKEFKIELPDLFGINVNDIDNNYKNEMKLIKNEREYITLDTNEYILKNIFNNPSQNRNYHVLNKYIIKNENNDKDKDEEEIALKDKEKNNNEIRKTLSDLFNDKNHEKINLRPIYFKVSKDCILFNLRKIFEKINSYEQDKLERKNIYNDYLALVNKYNEFSKNKMDFNVKIEPKLVFDTMFYMCEIDLVIYENNLEINNNYKSYELKMIKTESEDLNTIYNRSSTLDKRGKIEMSKTKVSAVRFKDEIKQNEEEEDKISNLKAGNNNANYFKKRIKINKISKASFCTILLFCIIVLLVTCIITLNYQTNLVNKDDKIYEALYYNYYQRTQLNYLNSIILSIFFELVNISNRNHINDNKDVLFLIGKNIEKSHQIFINFYMNFKMELNEDFSKLYEPLVTNEITVNWENRTFYNDYNSELALIKYRIIDTINHQFNQNDKEDCENLLLGKYLTINRKSTPVYGSFIKLVYFFYVNFESKLIKYFYSLEDSFDESLKKFSQRTIIVYIILEIIALLSFLFFFAINLYYLIKSNKYIFHNILFIFIDFTQTKDYSFNNKYYNLLATKRASNYILLLKEFCPKNLDLLKKDKEIEDISILTNRNIKSSVIDEDINKSVEINSNNTNNNNMSKKQQINSKIKKRAVKKNSKNKMKLKTNPKVELNASKSNLSNMHSYNNLLNNSNYANNDKSLQVLNEGIHNLNNKDLNDISNNSMTNNSRNYSTNLILNSSHISNSTITNNIINNNSILIGSNTLERKNENNIIDDLTMNTNTNNEDKITIEKILSKTNITMIYSIKYLIIVFIIFTLIFIVYYIYKLIISLLFISNFQYILNDFKSLTLQYNYIIRYWNLVKTLFILPNATLYHNLNETEEYFTDINNKINQIYENRIKNYKSISTLYDILLDTSKDKNISSIDFCSNHKRCNDIKNSSMYLLTNGIESTINLYAKEISNYYKDFKKVKNTIKNKTDIINNFIDERYTILSSNINHVIIYLEELFFSYFYNDEKEIVNDFYLKIKLLNVIEVCYCALLNLFSILFVYNFITRIIYSVEEGSKRINNSIRRMKLLKIEEMNFLRANYDN